MNADNVYGSVHKIALTPHNPWWHVLQARWQTYWLSKETERQLSNLDDRIRDDIGMPRPPRQDRPLGLGMGHIWR